MSFEDNLILPVIFGSNDENLKKLEEVFNLYTTKNYLKIEGLKKNVETTSIILNKLYDGALEGKPIETGELEAIIALLKIMN